MTTSRCQTCHFRPCRCQDLEEGFRARGGFHKAAYPFLSDSMGVHPSQREAATAEARRLGVPTEFARNGSAVVESKAHRDQLAKALGLVDISKREITAPKGIRYRERSVGTSR